MGRQRRQAPPRWTVVPLELMRHAYGHYRQGEEADRRQALVGFDQTIEVAIQGFAQSEAPTTACSRAFIRDFRTKVDFLKAHLDAVDGSFTGSFVGIKYRHRIRNLIYHRPEWFAPPLAEVEAARRDAAAVLECLTGLSLESDFARRDGVKPVPVEQLPDRVPGRLPTRVARELEALAMDYAHDVDPDREGVHSREVWEVLRLDVPA